MTALATLCGDMSNADRYSSNMKIFSLGYCLTPITRVFALGMELFTRLSLSIRSTYRSYSKPGPVGIAKVNPRLW